MGRFFLLKFIIGFHFFFGSWIFPLSDEEILWGKFKPKEEEGFFPLAQTEAIRAGIYLSQETYKAFQKLQKAALKDGIYFRIVSGLRTFEEQKRIWENKFKEKEKNSQEENVLKTLRYSAFPGASRHHWGTEIDLTFGDTPPHKALVNETWEKGSGKKAYLWLRKNAMEYGFCQPYQNPPKERREGFSYGHEEEKWHWSYKPRSLELFKLLEKKKELPLENIIGAPFVKKYLREFLLNIHPECL